MALSRRKAKWEADRRDWIAHLEAPLPDGVGPTAIPREQKLPAVETWESDRVLVLVKTFNGDEYDSKNHGRSVVGAELWPASGRVTVRRMAEDVRTRYGALCAASVFDVDEICSIDPLETLSRYVGYCISVTLTWEDVDAFTAVMRKYRFAEARIAQIVAAELGPTKPPAVAAGTTAETAADPPADAQD
jgi:hypothetical protein